MGVLDTAKPFYRLEIFEPEATTPKFVISPNVFLDTEKPSNTDQASPEIYLTDLNINSNLNGEINICELKIQHNPGNAPAISIESKVKVYLGYYYLDSSQGAEYSLAFTGKLTRIKVRMQSTSLECRSSLYKLTRIKKKITYNTLMTIDEIINKLAIEQGGLELASSGIAQTDIKKQPGFSISDNKSLLDHIKLFSKYCCLYIYMDAEDKFHAAAWAPGDLRARSSDEEKEWISERDKNESSSTNSYKHELKFGRDLIECNFKLTEGKASAVELIGFMSFGDEEVHTIEPPKVEFTPSDGGDPDLPKKVFKISYITREDGEKIAENLYYALNINLVGKLVALGSPQIRLGDGVKVTGTIYDVQPFQSMDFSSPNSSGSDLESKIFQVVNINHRFNNKEGFITRLEFVDAQATPVSTAAAEERAAAEEEEAIIEMEIVEEDILEGEEEDQPITIIVKTFRPDNEPIPNADYILITPEGEELEGTTGEEGTFTHEKMPRGSYELKFKEITEPGEEEE
jgi:hypothetical protein